MPADRRFLLFAILGPLLLGAAFSASAAEPGWIAEPGNGCKVWNPNPQPDESIHWTGGCRDGMADGDGVLTWYGQDKSKETERETGRFQRGRMNDRHGSQINSTGVKITGAWVEGRLRGRAVLTGPNGEHYAGSWRDGQKDGFGDYVWPNGDRYIGFWHQGRRSGYGSLIWKKGGRYDGHWSEDAFEGAGTRVWNDGALYRGDWSKAVRSGKGKLTLRDGTVFEGDWLDDHPEGACLIKAADRSRYEGSCHGWGPDGSGVKQWPNGDRYRGEWQAGQRSGHGLFVTARGERYDGDWHFDQEDGKGVLIRADGSRYEGEMLSGKPSGWGVGIAAGGARQEGYWAGDRFLGAAWFAKNAAPPLPVWPQEASDIAADPAVLYGRLPNGMRYAILRNETPREQVSFRFRIAAGSIDEKPAQRGIAHFLEHMAFRGSARIPDGEAFRILERLGGQVGADTNAFTTQTQTSFHLNLPHGDRASLDAALTLMRETAGELSLTPQAIDSERAVVIAEERLFDTPAQHELIRQIGFLYRGQPIGDHLPIGDAALLDHFGAEDLRAFYRAYYRPERATLIVVGALEPAEMEKQIKDRFGDWRGQGEPGPEPDRQPPAPRASEAVVHTEAQSPGTLLTEWVAPFDAGADTRRREAGNVTRSLALGMINRLYDDAAHSGKAPFASVNMGFGDLSRSAAITQLSIGLSNLNDWRNGAGAVFGLLRRTLAEGFGRDDLDRQIAILRTSYDRAVTGAATRETRDLADGLLASVDNDYVFRTPATDKALFEQTVAVLTPEKAGAALHELIDGQQPLFFVGGMSPPADIVDLPALWTNTAAAAGEKNASETAAWPYEHFGDPGKVTARSADPALGLSRAVFENGVTLTVRPSKVSAGQILVYAYLDLPAWSRPSNATPPYWSCMPLMFGGLQKLSYADLADLLHRSGTSVNCTADPLGFTFSLNTQPDHLDVALQTLAAYLSDPAWRPEAMTQAHDFYVGMANQFDSTLYGRFERESPVLFRGGDVRWRSLPEPADPTNMVLDQAKAYLGPALADNPLLVVVTGDVTAERATQAVAATLGALPKRKGMRSDPPAAGRIKFPAANARPEVLKGPRIKDQALVVMAWPTHDAISDLDTVYDLEIASAVLSRRLFDTYRTEFGATYTPEADQVGDLDLPGTGYLYVEAIAPPAKLPLFYDTVNAILAYIRDHGIGADEFERARKPLLDGQIKEEQSNVYWADWLKGPSREAYARNRSAGLKRATPAAVQQAIRTYLLDSTAWKMEIRPES